MQINMSLVYPKDDRIEVSHDGDNDMDEYAVPITIRIGRNLCLHTSLAKSEELAEKLMKTNKDFRMNVLEEKTDLYEDGSPNPFERIYDSRQEAIDED